MRGVDKGEIVQHCIRMISHVHDLVSALYDTDTNRLETHSANALTETKFLQIQPLDQNVFSHCRKNLFNMYI